jgi:hypothetical protein
MTPRAADEKPAAEEREREPETEDPGRKRDGGDWQPPETPRGPSGL